MIFHNVFFFIIYITQRLHQEVFILTMKWEISKTNNPKSPFYVTWDSKWPPFILGEGGKTDQPDQPDLIPPILTSYPDVAKTFIGRLTSSNIVWSNLWKSWKVLLTLLMFKLFVKKYGSDGPLGTTSKKNPSYSVTLSLKVGGGQDEIILLGAAKIVTRW